MRRLYLFKLYISYVLQRNFLYILQVYTCRYRVAESHSGIHISKTQGWSVFHSFNTQSLETPRKIILTTGGKEEKTYKGKDKCKGKGHPTTGHEGPDGEQKYSSTLSLTTEVGGGEWSAPRPGRFTPKKDSVPIVQEAGWSPGPVWTGAHT